MRDCTSAIRALFLRRPEVFSSFLSTDSTQSCGAWRYGVDDACAHAEPRGPSLELVLLSLNHQ